VAGFGSIETSAGIEHTCAITSANYAYCWGKGADGRLGTGNNDRSLIPKLVTGGRKYEAISAANEHTCAISQGVGYCWGKGADGRLGRGNNSDSSSPVAVSGTQVFTQISATFNHTCAVSNLGEIYCWGQGGDGRLANNGTGSESVPTKIENPQGVATIAWAMVAAGEMHSCGLTTTNEAYCWGANGSGQIGDGTTDGRLIPVLVDVSGLNGATFEWIGAGRNYSCGRTAAGALYCWGSNEFGKLGINSDDASRSTPTLVVGDHIFTTTSIGRDHVCGATLVDVYCWGLSDNGRLGGTDMDQKQPFMLPNAPAYMGVAAGGAHSCGIAPDSFLECFGMNNEGQVGINTQVDQLVPAGVWP
jgi:alpha-tubulin suppressor-like RCC1 family protein